MTKDLICAVQLLNLEIFIATNVVTDIISENISARVFLFDTPTSTPLPGGVGY